MDTLRTSARVIFHGSGGTCATQLEYICLFTPENGQAYIPQQAAVSAVTRGTAGEAGNGRLENTSGEMSVSYDVARTYFRVCKVDSTREVADGEDEREQVCRAQMTPGRKNRNLYLRARRPKFGSSGPVEPVDDRRP